jgi:hypothetical protein
MIASDTSSPAFGPPSQVERLDALIEELSLARGHILDNLKKWADESDEQMTKRLRRNRLRLGGREARFRLTGCRNQSAKYGTLASRVLDFMSKRCKGRGFRFTEIPEAEIAKAVDRSPRHVRRILSDLDDRFRQLIRVERPGRPNAYAISLPESKAYQAIVMTTFDLHVDRLREAAAEEVTAEMMEGLPFIMQHAA